MLRSTSYLLDNDITASRNASNGSSQVISLVKMTQMIIGSPAEKTLLLLQERLGTAEKQAQILSEKLEDYGFNRRNENSSTKIIAEKSDSNKSRGEVSAGNSGEAVRRLCMLESLVESLRSGMKSLELEKSSTAAELRQENKQIQENYTKEINNLNKDLDDHKKAKILLNKQLQKLTKEVKRAVDSEKVLKGKLKERDLELTAYQEKLTEISKSVSSERSSKKKVEDKHNGLLFKVTETEAKIENERINVQKLNAKCESLTNDALLAREEFEKEYERRIQLEELVAVQEGEIGVANLKLLELSQETSSLQQSSKELEQRITSMDSDTEKLKIELRSVKTENHDLKASLKMAVTDNQALISQSKETITKEQKKLENMLSQQNKILESAKNSLLSELEKQQKRTKMAEDESAKLQINLSESEAKKNEMEFKLTIMQQSHAMELSRLQGTLEHLEKTKTEQKLKITKLETDILNTNQDYFNKNSELLENNSKLKSRLDELENSHRDLKETNLELKEKLSWNDLDRKSQRDIHEKLTDIVKQKNSLAYEKGLLQSRLDTLLSKNDELSKVNEKASSYQEKYDEICKQFNEVSSSKEKIMIEFEKTKQHLQAEMKEHKNVQSKLTKVEDRMETLITARDKALLQVESLVAHIQEQSKENEKEKHHLHSRITTNEKHRENMSSTFESLLTTNDSLQKELEQLQVELGRKDAELANLKDNRLDSNDVIQGLKTELEVLTTKLDEITDQDRQHIEKLKSELSAVKELLVEMQNKCEKLSVDKNKLKTKLVELKNEVKQKDNLLKDYIQDRQKCTVQQNAEHEETMERLKKEKFKELNKLREQTRSLKSSLKQKENETESSQLQLQVLSNQVLLLEQNKSQYEEKNDKQSILLQSFIQQISELQEEINIIATTQNDTTLKLKSKEDSLEKERKKRHEVEIKYKTLLQQHAESELLKRNLNLEKQNACEKQSNHVTDLSNQRPKLYATNRERKITSA